MKKIIVIALLLNSLVLADKVPLGSLDLSKMSCGWGKPLVDRGIQDKPLLIGGRQFAHGVGTHADSSFYLDLKGQARRFTASVGVDDNAGAGKGSVRFRVYADDRRLFDSGVMKAGMAAQPVDVPLTGAKTLILMALSCGDGFDFDHANWADAIIDMADGAPIAISAPAEPAEILTPPPGPQPQINGPSLWGARPGNPFIYRIPATGDRPLRFEAANLPAGLKLDARTGIVTGHSPGQRGNYDIVFTAANSRGQSTRPFRLVVGDTLALTPPMGWNDWYIHFSHITDAHMRNAADVMIESGMADFGYCYVNIDDCWSKKRGEEPYRDDCGAILPNSNFPDMRALTDYIHGKGLRAGIYTSPGPWNCAGYTGSFQHEQQDAQQFAEWGFDFLKYDWCSYRAVDESRYEFVRPYALMGEILKNVGRDMVYNLCQYGMSDVWEWGASVDGNCWRTTGDLGLMSGFMEVGLSNAAHYEFAGPGHWNDPDYILIGQIGDIYNTAEQIPCKFTPNQQYQYMSMWCLMASPLIFSGDMAKLDPFTVNILCNAEVIAVDQDPLGRQGRIVHQTGDGFIMIKPLADGSHAVGLFNLDLARQTLELPFAEYGLPETCQIRDLWRQSDLGAFQSKHSVTVPPRGVALWRIAKP